MRIEPLEGWNMSFREGFDDRRRAAYRAAQCSPRRAVVVLAMLLGISLIGACKRQPEPPTAQKPSPAPARPKVDTTGLDRITGKKGMNVLFVSVDTTRADHMSCYGHPILKTPNVDRLAAEGVRFAWCISSAPLTLVSHSTMMTGSYQYVHGARDNGMFSLSDDNVTLAEILLDEGYTTAAEVAAVVLDAKYGLNQGFEWYGEVKSSGPEGVAGVALPKLGQEESAPAMEVPQAELERKATEITDRGIDLMRERAAGDKPFFIFLHYYDPHWPHEAPEEYRRMYDDPYYAEIAYWDHEFGRLLDEVDRLELAENTLVVLVSDHGEGRGQHGEYSHSCFLYDTTLHVPCILRCKGTIPPGLVVESQVRLVDMAPTVLEFVGLASRVTEQMQGTSLLPLLANPELDLALECYSDTLTPLLMYHYAPLRSLRAEGWKYILAPSPELYHVAEDEFEVFNRSAIDSERSFQMRQQLWDLIENSPPPPGGQRGGVIETDLDTVTQLRALGYVSSVEEMQAFTSGRELDYFDPVGENPRDHTEEMEMFASALGALRMGAFENAETHFVRFLERNPKHAIAQSSLVMCYIGQERWEEAVTACRRSIELQPDSHEEYRKLGLLLGRLRRLDEAEKAFRDGMAIEGHDFKMYMHLAGLYAHLRRHDEALDILLKGTQAFPKETMLYYALGSAYARNREMAKAIESFERVLQLDPENVHAHGAIIMSMRTDGRLDDAIAYADRALEKHPTATGLLYEKAMCLAERGETQAVGQLFARIVELEPKNIDGRVWLATNLTNQNKLDEAIAQYRAVLELDPDHVLAKMRLSAALNETGHLDEALDLLLQVTEKSPENCEAHRVAAHLCDLKHDSARAIGLLDKALQRCDGDPRILNDLAWRLATTADTKLRDGARAVELARKASALASDDNPYYLDTLAAAYAEVGDFEKAVAIADRAVNVAQETGDGQVGVEISARRAIYQAGKPYREH